MARGYHKHRKEHSINARKGKKFALVFGEATRKQTDTRNVPKTFPTYNKAYNYGVGRWGSGGLEHGQSASQGWAIRDISNKSRRR